MNHEQRFWEQVQAQLGAHCAINSTDAPSSKPPSGFLHGLYIIDASNRFTASAWCSDAAFRDAVGMARKLQAELGVSALEAASAMLSLASKGAGTAPSQDLLTRAMIAAMLGLVTTQTWAIAKESLRQRPGHPHWALVLYRCANQDCFVRPLFVKSVAASMMPQAMVDEWVATGLKQDLDPASPSQISQRLQRAGGTIIDPALRSIVERLRQRTS